MRRWIAAAGMAVALGAAAAALPASSEGGSPELGLESNRFLFFATLEGLCEDGLSDAAVKAVLEKDEKGHYRNFVYACPVCSPVVEGFRAYAMRNQFYYSRKGDPLAPWYDESNPSPLANLEARLTGTDATARGKALHDLVERYVQRRMDRLRLRDDERAAWRQLLQIGRKKGMGFLGQSEGFQHKSCPSCDGASGTDFGVPK
jgi:hypothetical protein